MLDVGRTCARRNARDEQEEAGLTVIVCNVESASATSSKTASLGKSRHTDRSGKRSLRFFSMLVAPPALSQEAGVEEVVVTGSRIRRQDFEANSPIVTVSEELFEET